MLLVNPNFTQRNKSVLAYATNRMQFIHSLKVIQGDLLFFIHLTYNVGLTSIGALVIKLKNFIFFGINMFWDRLRVIFARSVRSAPKHNYAQERSTVIINLEGIESNEKKETTIHFERLRERASGRKHILPRLSLNCPYI